MDFLSIHPGLQVWAWDADTLTVAEYTVDSLAGRWSIRVRGADGAAVFKACDDLFATEAGAVESLRFNLQRQHDFNAERTAFYRAHLDRLDIPAAIAAVGMPEPAVVIVTDDDEADEPDTDIYEPVTGDPVAACPKCGGRGEYLFLRPRVGVYPGNALVVCECRKRTTAHLEPAGTVTTGAAYEGMGS